MIVAQAMIVYVGRKTTFKSGISKNVWNVLIQNYSELDCNAVSWCFQTLYFLPAGFTIRLNGGFLLHICNPWSHHIALLNPLGLGLAPKLYCNDA